MYDIECTIEGLVPMMFDKFFDPKQIEKPQKKKAKGVGWKEELIKRCYVANIGKKNQYAYVPVDNIRMMLVGNQHRPGAAKILGSFVEKGKGTQYLNFCKSCIWVMSKDKKEPMKVLIEPKRKTYDDYDERSFINSQGSRSITRRPIFNTPWKLTFIIQVTDEQYDESKVKQFLEVAGMRCGCGAYGPTFGRFRITKWKKK